jgi:hypothetical protein
MEAGVEETRLDNPMTALGMQLESLADLQKKGLIEDSEYQEMRAGIVQQMKKAAVALAEPEKLDRSSTEATAAQPFSYASYGDLHNLMVEMISAQLTNADGDVRAKMYEMVSEIAEKRVISAIDTSSLMRIIDIVYDAEFNNTDISDEQVTVMMINAQITLSTMSDQMRSRLDASAPAKAIAEVAEQSAKKAMTEMVSVAGPMEDMQPAQKAQKKLSIWKAIVQPDLKGAFEGCQAGVALHPVAADFSTIALPAAAAITAIIGAGFRSGAAYNEFRTKNMPG